MIGLLLAFKKDKPSIDVSAHADDITTLILYAIVLIIAFFVVRPELWRRMLLVRVDPRPAALMRISYGFVVLWTFLDLAFTKGTGAAEFNFTFLFTDEGLWLTDMARRNYSGDLKTLWDPEMGFEHWYDIFKALWGRMSILHFRSDPPFVMAVFGAMFTSLTLMIFGFKTRVMTIVSWFLVESVYRYSPVYYTGGDTVTRVFMFLAMFANWGQAYSIDAWWRRRKAILKGSRVVPPLRKIAAWPMRLMFLQLAIIYCATGLLKSGSTWKTGTALYYALNLEHFYRFPQSGLVATAHHIGLLPASSIAVHWWEMLFPVVFLGLFINAYERERKDGTWPKAAIWRQVLGWCTLLAAWLIGAHVAGVAAHYYLQPKSDAPLGIPREHLIFVFRIAVALIPFAAAAVYFVLRRFLPRVFDFVRKWCLGRRLWLVVGFNMHIGIDISMNVGVFANVMMGVYFIWLSGEEIEFVWRYFFSRPMDVADRPSQADREAVMGKSFHRLPSKARGALFWVSRRSGLDRLLYRQPGKRYTVLHQQDEQAIRYAALLRCWDTGHRLDFVADDDEHKSERGPLRVQIEGDKNVLTGAAAGRALVRIFPGLWLFRPFMWVPGLGSALGLLALRILKQK
ncbi:MAG: hypothetical protein JKY37_14005 [Nannocystaceae bacterium]|nr:hypothetical protein [Nannocystaceae bacterium]